MKPEESYVRTQGSLRAGGWLALRITESTPARPAFAAAEYERLPVLEFLWLVAERARIDKWREGATPEQAGIAQRLRD